MEFSDTLDGRGGNSAKAAEIVLPSNTYKPAKSKMDVDSRKFPLITYKTTQAGIGDYSTPKDPDLTVNRLHQIS